MTFAQKLCGRRDCLVSAAENLRRSIFLPGQGGRTAGGGVMTPAYG